VGGCGCWDDDVSVARARLPWEGDGYWDGAGVLLFL